VPGRRGATNLDVDSADDPEENVATAPGGRVSASSWSIGVPGCCMRTLSFPLSPRAGGASAASAASVRYATEWADPSVNAVVILAVAGVTAEGSPEARARAIDHDQPMAKRTSRTTENTLKSRSAFPGEWWNPRGRFSGNANNQSPGVALRGEGVELARLSSILPL
jgi:hypothetical protein